MTAKETLISWLEAGYFEEVFEGLTVVQKKWGHKDLAADISFQTGRYNTLKDQQSRQTISQSDFQVELAKIREALYDLLNKFSDHWTSEGLEDIALNKCQAPLWTC